MRAQCCPTVSPATFGSVASSQEPPDLVQTTHRHQMSVLCNFQADCSRMPVGLCHLETEPTVIYPHKHKHLRCWRDHRSPLLRRYMAPSTDAAMSQGQHRPWDLQPSSGPEQDGDTQKVLSGSFATTAVSKSRAPNMQATRPHGPTPARPQAWTL